MTAVRRIFCATLDTTAHSDGTDRWHAMCHYGVTPK